MNNKVRVISKYKLINNKIVKTNKCKRNYDIEEVKVYKRMIDFKRDDTKYLITKLLRSDTYRNKKVNILQSRRAKYLHAKKINLVKLIDNAFEILKNRHSIDHFLKLYIQAS